MCTLRSVQRIALQSVFVWLLGLFARLYIRTLFPRPSVGQLELARRSEVGHSPRPVSVMSLWQLCVALPLYGASRLANSHHIEYTRASYLSSLRSNRTMS